METDTVTKKIDSVRVARILDYSPDLSWLGEYSNEWEEGAIETGRDGHHYRYFIPAISGEESGNPDSTKEDFERMEAYNRQEWWSYGVMAKARTYVNGILQEITSAGLWGIESDAEEGYFEEISAGEVSELKKILIALCFPIEEIDNAFAVVAIEDEN